MHYCSEEDLIVEWIEQGRPSCLELLSPKAPRIEAREELHSIQVSLHSLIDELIDEGDIEVVEQSRDHTRPEQRTLRLPP